MTKAIALYEIYEGDEVVYVGITTRPAERLSTHRTAFCLSKSSRMVIVEWIPCKAFATRVETARIRTLKPKYNIRDNPDGMDQYSRRQTAWRSMAERSAARLAEAEAAYAEWLKAH